MAGAAHTLEYLQAEERLLELEIALADGHRLTLPPDDYPWDGIRRHAEPAPASPGAAADTTGTVLDMAAALVGAVAHVGAVGAEARIYRQLKLCKRAGGHQPIRTETATRAGHMAATG